MPELPQKLLASSSQKLFAWNGIAFLTPASCELALTELSKGLNRIVLEDDYAPRLELDWLEPKETLSAEKVHARCQKQARELTEAALKVTAIPELPSEWTAHEYRMADGRVLVVGYRVPNTPQEPFPFFQVHFDAGSKEIPSLCFRQIANSFSWFSEGVAPWSFYDVAFYAPRELRLSATSLQAGRKTLIFEWRLRRLFITFISLADMALREKTLAEYTADFLNATKLFPVPAWRPDGDTDVAYSRKKRYFIGQFEEIGRFCFRYKAACQLLAEKNQIAIQMAQYRKEADLETLAIIV